MLPNKNYIDVREGCSEKIGGPALQRILLPTCPPASGPQSKQVQSGNYWRSEETVTVNITGQISLETPTSCTYLVRLLLDSLLMRSLPSSAGNEAEQAAALHLAAAAAAAVSVGE
jgi:hypothetical protein